MFLFTNIALKFNWSKLKIIKLSFDSLKLVNGI